MQKDFTPYLVIHEDGTQTVVLVPKKPNVPKAPKTRSSPRRDAGTDLPKVNVAEEPPKPSCQLAEVRPRTALDVRRELLSAFDSRRARWLAFGGFVVTVVLIVVIIFSNLVSPTVLIFGEDDSGVVNAESSSANSSDDDADKASNAMSRKTSGTKEINGEQVDWQLVQPIIDNRHDFGVYFPDATYLGDIGDASHFEGRLQDHTPLSTDSYEGVSPQKGWIYAQDLGGGSNFDVSQFSRWLIDRLKEGKYPHVKYVITRQPSNKPEDGETGPYYGCFSRQYDWEPHDASGHDFYIHISYMMTVNGVNYESENSTIIKDYVEWLANQQ